jgi:hypothetical protein
MTQKPIASSSTSALPTLQSAIADRSLMAATPPSQHAEMTQAILSLPGVHFIFKN